MPQHPPIVLGPAACGSPHHEWLVTDGLGGFATGTACGLRTRRYHALLTVANQFTAVRRTGLVSLDLTVTLPSGAKVPLYTHEWASGAREPRGDRHLVTFTLEHGLPRWRWRVGDVVIERELAMRHGHPSLAVVDRVVSAPEPVGLAVAALCTWRDAHGERYADGPAIKQEQLADGVVIEDAYRIAGPGWQPAGEWFLGAYAREEAARGLAASEDLWHAGTFVRLVEPGGALEISAWAGNLEQPPPPAQAVVDQARDRARSLPPLALAADAFLVRTHEGPDVVAGYPWFGSYLGDTMTAYEGLFLCTGRADEGRELLVSRTGRVSAKLTPGDGTWAPQDSPDAPLWLVHAVDRHVARTGDHDLAAELARPLAKLLRHRLGGDGPLRVDPADELIRLDNPGSWMNGSTARGPVTPRIGKPVEINALWVNALAALAGLLETAGRDASEPRARHAKARASFVARFPAPQGWLYDVIDGPASTYPLGASARHDDPTLRPNQLFAWSLPYGPLRGISPGILGTVGGALLTPLGLRTLAPSEYGYQGVHRGCRDERDIAYHQGTVWPWLLGAWVDAGAPADDLRAGLDAHLSEWGIGSVSETADGDAPHRATGCPFSARSVAEVLRVLS